MAQDRSGEIARQTSETDIRLTLYLDGTGASSISTGCGFLDHMLDQTARHGYMDMQISARGDVHVDYHHLVEDVGICLGQAVDKCLGDRAGIRRYGDVSLPMDEALVHVVVDMCGRGHLTYNVQVSNPRVGEIDSEVIWEFFRAFSREAKVSLHINLIYGHNTHHIFEAVFKAFGRAIREACAVEPRMMGIPSTKGIL